MTLNENEQVTKLNSVQGLYISYKHPQIKQIIYFLVPYVNTMPNQT